MYLILVAILVAHNILSGSCENCEILPQVPNILKSKMDICCDFCLVIY